MFAIIDKLLSTYLPKIYFKVSWKFFGLLKRWYFWVYLCCFCNELMTDWNVGICERLREINNDKDGRKRQKRIYRKTWRVKKWERDEERNSMRMRGKREMKHEKPVQIEHGSWYKKRKENISTYVYLIKKHYAISWK